MPEWTSFTVDDQGQAHRNGPEAQPTPAQPHDATSGQWSTRVEKLSWQRLKTMLEDEALTYQMQDNACDVQLNGMSFRLSWVSPDGPWLRFDARPIVDPHDFPAVNEDILLRASNRWNTEHLQPKITPALLKDRFGLTLSTAFFVQEGASQEQLHTMLRRAITVTFQALGAFHELITEASTEAKGPGQASE